MSDEPSSQGGHAVCVFAPMLHLTVMVEVGELDSDAVQHAAKDGEGGDEIHIHPGGQGLWIARMLTVLGDRPSLCGPVGGELGTVLRALIAEWEIEASLVPVGTRSPGYVQDRRSGERVTVADQEARRLDRHEIDDLYGHVLELALSSDAFVLTSAPTAPDDLYRRLGADLSSAQVRVFGDLHGDGLAAFLENGSIELLKVSHEDLITDGWECDTDADAGAAIRRLQDMGVSDVVVSRSDAPALASLDGAEYLAKPPELEVVDHLGAGDSMTAGLVHARLEGLSPQRTLQLASAAGAANVTRRGLGSGSHDLITTLADSVEVADIPPGSVS